VLNRELSRAVTDVDVALGSGGLDLPVRVYSTPRTHLTRAVAHRLIGQAEDLRPWELNPFAGPNTPIHLYNGQGMTTVRVLHAHVPAFVPSPGSNHTRRAFYVNTPLDSLEAVPALIQQQNFLVLWNEDPHTGEVNLRLAHTTGIWKHGGEHQCDLIMDMPSDEEEYFGTRFEPADEDEFDKYLLPNELEIDEEDGDVGLSS